MDDVSPTNPPTARNDDGIASAAGDARRLEFDAVVGPHAPVARKVALRLLGSPADADDVAQESLVTAFERLADLRDRGSARAWLAAIATKKSLDLLRARRRWPRDAQERGEVAFLASEAAMGELGAALSAESLRYEYREHVAYCFTCVGRSLDPEESAALVLTEVVGLTSLEAAAAIGVNEATLRHRLAAARATMASTFEGLCALVGKGGVCYQCAKLRDLAPEGRRGPEVAPIAPGEAPPDEKLRRRLAIVRDADLEGSAVHAVLQRFMSELFG
ncbi:MAG: RNA polymerase sigma factor [Myxococcales bacterium]|nr:RNA polymerase sigma factor [Myxococcales bacterium]